MRNIILLALLIPALVHAQALNQKQVNPTTGEPQVGDGRAWNTDWPEMVNPPLRTDVRDAANAVDTETVTEKAVRDAVDAITIPLQTVIRDAATAVDTDAPSEKAVRDLIDALTALQVAYDNTTATIPKPITV